MNSIPNTLGVYSSTRAFPIGDQRLVVISGLTARDGDTGWDVLKQTELIFSRMEQLLKAEGGDLSHVIKLTTYMVDLREYSLYNQVRNRIFGAFASPPASATVGVSELVRPELRIEIEGWALVPHGTR